MTIANRLRYKLIKLFLRLVIRLDGGRNLILDAEGDTGYWKARGATGYWKAQKA